MTDGATSDDEVRADAVAAETTRVEVGNRGAAPNRAAAGRPRYCRSFPVGVRASKDQGSASVWVLAVGLAVVTVGAMAAAVGAAVVARHQAQAAADLGALAAAVHALEGESVACRHAARVVSGNDGRLVSCQVRGLEAVVAAEVDPVGLAGAVAGPAQAKARAGPAPAA